MPDYTSQIKSFGALGYSADRIVSILNLKGKERMELLLRLSLPGDEYYAAHQNGLAVGEWNIDTELAKQAEKGDVESITALAGRSKERKLKDLKKNLFGI